MNSVFIISGQKPQKCCISFRVYFLPFKNQQRAIFHFGKRRIGPVHAISRRESYHVQCCTMYCVSSLPQVLGLDFSFFSIPESFELRKHSVFLRQRKLIHFSLSPIKYEPLVHLRKSARAGLLLFTRSHYVCMI